MAEWCSRDRVVRNMLSATQLMNLDLEAVRADRDAIRAERDALANELAQVRNQLVAALSLIEGCAKRAIKGAEHRTLG